MLSIFLMLIDDENDKLSFERIYEKYKVAVMKRALKLLNDNQFDADEAFQLTWIRVSQNIDKLRSKNEHVIATYILETLKYKAINVALGNKKWKAGTERIVTDEIENISDDLIFEICAKEKQETINRIIQNMDETYRDVLIFYFLDGFSVKEIASHMEIKEKTVWTKLYRGKQVLVEELRKEGITNDGH